MDDYEINRCGSLAFFVESESESLNDIVTISDSGVVLITPTDDLQLIGIHELSFTPYLEDIGPEALNALTDLAVTIQIEFVDSQVIDGILIIARLLREPPIFL